MAALLLALVAALGAGQAAAHAPPSPQPTDRPVAPGRLADGELRVRFLGTTTLLFDDGQTQILIDGYFSRPALARAALLTVTPNRAKITAALERARIGRTLRAILVAHAHIDHVLDAPTIAAMTGAQLIGSQSVALVGRGHGLPGDRFTDARNCRPCKYDAFTITAIKTPHSEPNLVPGQIDRPVRRRAWARSYRANSSYAFLIEHKGRRMLVYPSAAWKAGKLKDVRADVVFLSIAGLGRQNEAFADAYWQEVVRTVGAHTIYPIHWDDFGRSLGRGLRNMPWPLDNIPRGRAHLDRLARASCVSVGELPLFEPIKPPVPPPEDRRACRPAGNAAGDSYQ